MSWYPLHDVSRLGPRWRHRVYATCVVTLLLLLLALLLISDPGARCLVATDLHLATEEGDSAVLRNSSAALERALRDPNLAERVCRSAGVTPAELDARDAAELAKALELRIMKHRGAPTVAVHLELWTRRPSAARSLIEEWARAAADTGGDVVRQQQRVQAEQARATREQRHWKELELALTRYLDAVAAMMDAYFADTPREATLVSSEQETSPVSARIAGPAPSLNPQWEAVSSELQSLEEQLHKLQLIYAEKHPLVIQLRSSIQLATERLNQLPMAVRPPVAEADERTAVAERQNKFDLGILEETRRDLRRAVDAYLELRQTPAEPDATAATRPASRIVAPARITARHGGWRGARFVVILAMSLVAGLTIVAGAWGRSERLRSAAEMQLIWGGEVLGVLGEEEESMARRGSTFLRLLHCAECTVLLGLLLLVLVAIADPDFLANLRHDPRLALREWFRAR